MIERSHKLKPLHAYAFREERLEIERAFGPGPAWRATIKQLEKQLEGTHDDTKRAKLRLALMNAQFHYDQLTPAQKRARPKAKLTKEK